MAVRRAKRNGISSGLPTIAVSILRHDAASAKNVSNLAPMPSPAEMARQLRDRLADWADVAWLPATGSTNTDLLAEARAGLPLPRLRGTHLQHNGRGRADRNFRTASGEALMFSCSFAVALPLAALPTLSVVFGLAACEALAQRLPAGHRLGVKWPNDLQWGDAKLAGVLMESAAGTANATPRVVVGMGLNLRGADALSASLGRAVADWQAARCSDSPVELCVAVASAWRQAVADAERDWSPAGGLRGLAARYARHDALATRQVTVQDQGRVLFEGVAGGVADDGRLRVRTDSQERLVVVGDVSVRAAAQGVEAAG